MCNTSRDIINTLFIYIFSYPIRFKIIIFWEIQYYYNIYYYYICKPLKYRIEVQQCRKYKYVYFKYLSLYLCWEGNNLICKPLWTVTLVKPSRHANSNASVTNLATLSYVWRFALVEPTATCFHMIQEKSLFTGSFQKPPA